jgi:hypothetical protein
MDGELLTMQRCELELVPAALRFVIPRGSSPVGMILNEKKEPVGV